MADRRLTEDEAAAVFRRAAELDDARSAGTEGLDRLAVERAAIEVGLAPASVHQALAELDAGRLSVGQRDRWRWRDQVASVERFVNLDASAAQREMERYLRRQTMRVARRQGIVSMWEPASGLTATVVRGTDLAGRLRLKSVSQVALCVVPDGDGCRVRIDLDFRKARNDNRAGAAVGAVIGAGLAIGGAVAAVAGAEAAVAMMPVGGGVGVATWFGARSTYATAVRKAVTAIELAIDELEHPVEAM